LEEEFHRLIDSRHKPNDTLRSILLQRKQQESRLLEELELVSLHLRC